MSNLEPPPQSSAGFPPEKSPETEIPGSSTLRTNPTPNSTRLQPEDRHARLMENFKEIIFKFATSSYPRKALSPMQKSLIEQGLEEAFPSFRTPDHPPYSAIIEAAIQKLGEEGGSSEEAISQFIRKEHPDLPWAHDTILKHHLERLCENESIVETSNGLYMLGHVITKRDSAPSPCSSNGTSSSLSLSHGPDSGTSFSSWSSSSYCSSPEPERKRQLFTRSRKKQGRKSSKKKRSNKGNINDKKCAQLPKRRKPRPPNEDLSEDETEINAEHLMLEEKSEETEAKNKSKEETKDGAEGIDQVKGVPSDIRKRDQRQETGLVVEIRLDKQEDIVDEEQRELWNRVVKRRTAHTKPTGIPGRRRGRPRKNFLLVENTEPHAEQMKTDSQGPMLDTKTEVPEGTYQVDKELAEVLDDLNQLAIMLETLELSGAGDANAVSEVGKSGSIGEEDKLIKQCNFVMELKPEKDEAVVEGNEEKVHKNFEGIKEQSQLEEHGIMAVQDRRKRKGRPLKGSEKRRKVQPKPTLVPGRRARGRPRKKDLENCSELKGNMHGTLEWCQAEETKMVKEVKKLGSVAEEKLPINQLSFVKEKEEQKDWCVKGFNEQKAHENAFKEEQNQSEKEKNEMTFGKSQSKRRENQELNLCLRRHTESVPEREVEVPEMHSLDTRTHGPFQPLGKCESITEALISVDVAQRSMDCEAIVLPRESFCSVLQEGKEISNKIMELQREILGEEKVLEIGGIHKEVTEHWPESSTAGRSQLKSVERSSQPESLEQKQLQLAEEKPLDVQLRSHSPKSFSSCSML